MSRLQCAPNDKLVNLGSRGSKLATLTLDSRYYKYGISAIIFANALLLALYDYNEESVPSNIILDQLNEAFTLIYILEMILKIMA